MGIPGLTSYLFGNDEVQQAWDSYRLQDTRLVIDGLSLMGPLLGSSGPGGGAGDLRCGGQYQEFYWRICDFFAQLRQNAVEPIIILDGLDGGEKLVTARKRAADRTSQQHALSRARDQYDVLKAHEVAMPPWCGPVMGEALVDMGVPCITADGEADAVTAALARLFGCPVLSNDSDFFMFDLPGGLIHLRDLNINRPCDWPVKRYRRSQFFQTRAMRPLIRFIDERLIGLAAGLAGNDYVTAQELAQLRPLYLSCHGHHYFEKALRWLVAMEGCGSVEDGYKLLERKLPVAVRDRIMAALRFSVDFYDVTSPERAEEAKLLVGVDTCLFTSIRPNPLCGIKRLPQWLVRAFRLGGFCNSALSAAQR